jgi:phage shock protein C
MKRLYKSRKNKVFAGVCGGIAEYFDIDPVLVRLIFILFLFIGGSAIIAYIIGAIIMPNPPAEPVEATDTKAPSPKPSTKTVQKEPAPAAAPASRSNASLIIGIILVLVGAYFLMGNLPFLREYYWWFRWHLRDFFVPGIFIVIGLILLIHGSRKDQQSS